ncbi:Uncharacterized protein ABJ98_2070 [Pseudomonas syringae pv. aceris]|nr:Uncharacterized protein ABJ98_2070 [Pseudomonas syringae pv. aceris]
MPTRSNKRVPNALSSSFNAALVADWDSARALPALVVLPQRVIAQKICNCRRLILKSAFSRRINLPDKQVAMREITRLED